MQNYRAQYEKDGFIIAPPMIEPGLLARVREHMQLVMDGKLERAGEYQRAWPVGGDPTVLRKIDQAHVVDSVIHELISSPAIGRIAAEITGAKKVQVWATQLLFKPPGGKQLGTVGWHQDDDYWHPWFTADSNHFTAWVAVSDVTNESGPMRFVPGSHKWGHLNQGNFFGKDLEQLKAGITIPDGGKWTEVSATMPAGACSFHNKLTIHGSGANVSDQPRMSFAIHLRTEQSTVGATSHYYNQHLTDPLICPMIYS